MQRFYTHLDNGQGYQRDTEGSLFSDVEAARSHAVRTGAAILADELLLGDEAVKMTLYIVDQDCRQVAAVSMSASIKHETGPEA